MCYKDVDDWEYNITIMSVTYNHMKDARYHFVMPSGEERVASSEYLDYPKEEDPTQLFVGLSLWLLKESPYVCDWVTIIRMDHQMKDDVVVKNETGDKFSVSAQQLKF